jgi:hypothetical protein
VIRVDDRAAYLAALESASVDGDIQPFARFIGQQVRAATATAAPAGVTRSSRPTARPAADRRRARSRSR